MRHRRRVTRQAVELGFAAPEVIARRMLRIAAAGATPSARDRQEMTRMGSEKVAAFWESWNAMALESMRIGWRLAFAGPSLWWRVAASGLGPWHRRAVGNATRLRGRRRRRG